MSVVSGKTDALSHAAKVNRHGRRGTRSTTRHVEPPLREEFSAESELKLRLSAVMAEQAAADLACGMLEPEHG